MQENEELLLESRVFKFGGLNVISGLLWSTLGSNVDPKKESTKAIGSTVLLPAKGASKRAASDFNADYATWRQFNSSTPSQVGLAQYRNIENKSKKLYSFAGVVLSGLEKIIGEDIKSSCIVYRLNELYYIVIQYDGIIIPGGDNFYNLETAREVVLENTSIGGYKIYAPEELNIPNSLSLPAPEDIISELKKPELSLFRLLPVNASIKKIALIAFFSLLAMYAVFFGVNQYQQAIKAAKERQANLLMEQLRAESAKQTKIQTYTTDNIYKLLSDCMSSIEEHSLFPGGWALKGAECKGETVKLFYARNNSQISYLQDAAPTAVIDPNGDLASITKPLKRIRSEVSEKELNSYTTVINSINNFSQKTGVDISTNSPAPAVSLPGREADKPNNSSFISWTLKTNVKNIVENFVQPNSAIQTIQYVLGSKGETITIKGKTYVKK